MNKNYETAGEARAKIFSSIVLREGSIKRGVLVSRMHISPQTFVREFKDYMDQYPMIKYNKIEREFTYEP